MADGFCRTFGTQYDIALVAGVLPLPMVLSALRAFVGGIFADNHFPDFSAWLECPDGLAPPRACCARYICPVCFLLISFALSVTCGCLFSARFNVF